MAEQNIQSLGDLSGALESLSTAGAERDTDTQSASGSQSTSGQERPVRERKVDAHGRAYATGRRKDATARVWIKPGPGRILVNGKECESYFARDALRMILTQPLVATSRDRQYDVTCTVSGGGLSGQAGAVRHGLSRALVYYEPDLCGLLKKGGFLTRDSRVVERKKYGRRKARRSFQFSKR